ncbi:Hypothetical protein PHPALM_6993 [Phytophthora palmivora]|uniref:Uncharacterized protein n=1 Tax=Phytophthora palmivora TaxID=4796 RepID=A0A2P4YDG0_9STRA|nr:Hypothetical protein PHPALM_6993 [Phytophthora palmivora]
MQATATLEESRGLQEESKNADDAREQCTATTTEAEQTTSVARLQPVVIDAMGSTMGVVSPPQLNVVATALQQLTSMQEAQASEGHHDRPSQTLDHPHNDAQVRSPPPRLTEAVALTGHRVMTIDVEEEDDAVCPVTMRVSRAREARAVRSSLAVTKPGQVMGQEGSMVDTNGTDVKVRDTKEVTDRDDMYGTNEYREERV